MAEARVAVIGGSGFYGPEGLAGKQEVSLKTPFGEPSDAIMLGTLSGVAIAFLPRHGKGHRLLPSEVPARANIYALKTLGIERIISINAVGSLREEISPRHLVVPDQLIDRTGARASTFLGDGMVAHVSMADPFCPELSGLLLEGARETGATVHGSGTAVIIEGPAFSTRAESQLHRAWGADLVGMTMLPEAKLAREAGICYAALACVTDYDVWCESEATVSVEVILRNQETNIEHARKAITWTIGALPGKRDCGCASALRDAVVTPIELVPEETRRTLAPIFGSAFLGGEKNNDG